MATQPRMNEDLVQVFDTEQESEAMVVRGLLESEGIDALVSALDAPQDVLPGVGGIVVRVAASDAERARQIIEDYRTSGDTAADEGEINSESAELTEPTES